MQMLKDTYNILVYSLSTMYILVALDFYKMKKKKKATLSSYSTGFVMLSSVRVNKSSFSAIVLLFLGCAHPFTSMNRVDDIYNFDTGKVSCLFYA